MFGLVPFSRRNGDIAKRNDFWDLRNVMDEFFNDSFVPTFFASGHPLKADIRETEKEYIIDAEMPGVKKEDIKLDLRDDVLTIAVEHNEERKEERDNYLRKERRYGSYSRSFCVENVQQEAVTAKYNNGVLTVVLPKAEDRKPKGHTIDIQ